MKKFTLLLCLFVVSVMMPQVVMAEELNASSPKIVKSATNDTLTITSAAAGQLKTFMDNGSNSTAIGTMKGCTKLVLKGEFNANDLDAIKKNNSDFAFTSVDMSAAKFPKALSATTYCLYPSETDERPDYNQFTKIIIGGKLYQSTSSSSWVYNPTTSDAYNQANDKSSPTEWSQRELDNGTNPTSGNANGRYFQIIVADYYKQKTSWEDDVNNNEAQVKEVKPQSGSYGGERIKVPSSFAYYRLNIENNNKTWVEATQEEINSNTFTFDENYDDDRDNSLYKYNIANTYVKFATAYNYYKWAKSWEHIEQGELPDNPSITYFNQTYETDPSYRINENIEYGGFLNHYNYYQVIETTTYSWNTSETVYNKGEGKYILSRAATFEGLQTPTDQNQWAVVGGTEYKYDSNNNKWVIVLETASNDYTLIKFSYWDGSIETAILPADVLSYDFNESDWSKSALWTNSDDVLLTTVRAGDVIATITKAGSHRTAVLNIASNRPEFARMEAIITLNNFVKPGEVTSSVGEEGYNETTQKYTVRGALDADAISDINGYGSSIKVLDLKNATGVDKNALSQLNNSKIEYIILPGDKDKAFVCDSTNYYSGNPKTLNMSNLKAVVSSEGNTLVAHVVEPGSLAQGRCYATGLKDNKDGHPAVVGLTSVTLSGSLNLSDITVNEENNGLSGEKGTIVSMDLEKAIFPNNNDMNFLSAGFQGNTNECVLKKISLPTDPRMIHIPVNCFRNIKSLDSLCIPFNYQYIHDGALYDTNIEHLTTTDSIGGVVIDNGMYTYTLSANIKQLGDKPEPLYNASGLPEESLGEYVFPKENGVTEFYTLATKVPICYRNTFSYDLTFGYGGQDQQKVYGRDRFFNNGDRKKSFVVLRYPSEEVFNRRKAKGKPVENDTTINGKTISGYRLMEMKYTDVTKVYTKKDQTGAVDANGNPLLWPSRTEGNRAYNQATVGALWDDWGKEYTGENDSEINDTETGILPTNSRSMARRFEGESKTRSIDLTQGKSAEGVESVQNPNGTGYKFTPTQNVKNMFQYLNMPVTYDGVTYNKIVVKFAAPVPAGFNYHAYGERGVFYSLEGKTEIEIRLNGNPIDDFTIFNWDDGYWNDSFTNVPVNDRRSITITEAYFTTDGSSDNVVAKYKHDKANNYPFDLVDYLGWHQIVLNQAAYYEPVVKKEGETIKRNYKKTGACTFCIPYDLSYSQVVKMLGIPKSAGNVENYDENGTKVENNDKLPDIRQLLSVTRTVFSDHNQVDYRLSTNLAADPTDVKYLECKNADGSIKDAPVYASAKKRALANAEGALTSDTVVDADPRCIIGGRPYIINAYVLNSDTVDGRNLGLYIMTRYAKELEDSSSCVNNGKEFYEQLSTYKVEGEGSNVVKDENNVLTMRFAKPYEDHKIRAFSGTDGENGYIVYDKPKISNAKSPQTETKNYYYAMVGQFWEQDLPEYCVYMTRKGEWKRYTHPEYGFKWDRYKCVFMATPDITSNDFVDSTTVVQSLIPDEQTKELIKADQIINGKDTLTKPYDYVSTFEHFGGGFRNLANCYFPMNYKNTYDWIPAPMKLWFFGRSDRDFETQRVHSAFSPSSRTSTLYTLTMDNDDEIIEYDGEVTHVKTIDMLDGVPQLTGKSRVYSLSGQYMGNTTEGLRKGVYIVDGRKIVVE